VTGGEIVAVMVGATSSECFLAYHGSVMRQTQLAARRYVTHFDIVSCRIYRC